MKLAHLLSVETIAEELTSREQGRVLFELADLLVKAGKVPAGADLPTILMNREDLGTTGIGEGVAIPHVRLKDVSGLRMAVGRSREGVEFNAADGLPVHIFFLMVAPEEAPDELLKALARVSRLLKRQHFKRALLEAADRAEMLRVIVAEDEKD